MLFASAPIHVILIRNDTILVVSKNTLKVRFAKSGAEARLPLLHASVADVHQQLLLQRRNTAQRNRGWTQQSTQNRGWNLGSGARLCLGWAEPLMPCACLHCAGRKPTGINQGTALWCCSTWPRELQKSLLSCFIAHFPLKLSQDYQPCISVFGQWCRYLDHRNISIL